MTAFFIIAFFIIVFVFILGTIANAKQKKQEEEFECKMDEAGAVISQQVKCYNAKYTVYQLK